MQKRILPLDVARAIVNNVQIQPQPLESKKQDLDRSPHEKFRKKFEDFRDSLNDEGYPPERLSRVINDLNVTISKIEIPSDSRILRHGILKPRARIAGTGEFALRFKEFSLDMVGFDILLAPETVKVSALKEREVTPKEAATMESKETIRQLYHRMGDSEILELGHSITSVLRSDGGPRALADALRSEIMAAMMIKQDPWECSLNGEDCTKFFVSGDDAGKRIGEARSRWRKNLQDSLRTHFSDLLCYLA